MQRINVVEIKMVKIKNLSVENKKIGCPRDSYQILNEYLKGADREYLVVMGLNTKNQVNSIETVSIGSLNSSIVHPREVFKMLVLSNSASFIMGHNHRRMNKFTC